MIKRILCAVLATAALSVPAFAQVKALPKRSEVKVEDTWDLTRMFKSDAEWEEAFKKWEARISGYEQFKGKLSKDAATLAACMKFDAELNREGERIGNYAELKVCQDQGNSQMQTMEGRFGNAAARAGEASSFMQPELMAIPAERMTQLMSAAELAEWRLALERILRFRAHTLSPAEEQLLAMQGPMSETAVQVFRQLNDADMKFGTIANEKGEQVELSNATYASFLNSQNREIRKAAFLKLYEGYDAHKNTLAGTLNGVVQRDVFLAKARKYPTALEAALYPDNVPVAVYDNLIEAVHRHLPAVYKYYALRKRAMKLNDIHMYDCYVPILPDLDKRYTWEEAVKVTVAALKPLGEDYTRVFEKGLTVDRWADRYPNAGKRSGAFSSGSFDTPPYILMNYKEDVLDDVFTLAHEGGHSMHSYFSSRNQPYQYYSYSLFVAEVASTFNETLLGDHMLKNAKDKRERAYLLNREIDSIRATIIRQTMFAEFEKVAHATVERGEPLTADTLKKEYRKLLDLYFGPDFALDDQLSLECLRIPHFYRDFYVYKYATGLSAAIALADRVLHGGDKERQDYLNFLKGGCSKHPLDLLRDAGVDMEKPAPVDAALKRFEQLVDELEKSL